MNSTTHAQKVDRISTKVAEFYKRKQQFKVFHGSTNSTRVLSFDKNKLVDISDLNEVLSVDTAQKVAQVEPNVSMEKLVKVTLKNGLIPPVVMEFPNITVGGAIQGNGGESSSFKWGAFNQTVMSFEMVTGDGEVITATNKHNSDIFYGVPGTAGTIGILTSATLKLIPAKKYVQLEYKVAKSFNEAKTILQALSKDPKNDFIDGIMFSKDEGIIAVGRFSDKPVSKIVQFRRARDQWYYLHVQKTLRENPSGWSEAVPLTDYLFRYDRGAFWVGRFAFELFNIPYTRFMRWVFNPILNTKKLYQALQESGQSQHHIVQDIALPARNFVSFCQFVDKEFGTYPLWLCPMLVDTKSPFQLNNLPTQSIINVGVWGAEIPDYDEFIRKNRLLEAETLKLRGKKWSYAHSYFTKKEFWSMYDEEQYLNLRKKYHSTNLPTIYDKITVTSRVPIQKRKAVLRTIFGLAKLKIK